MKKNSLVSIIVPVYNSSKYIDETIQSVLMQTYTEWELLLTDDCSTDNSVDIIKKYLYDNRIKLFQLSQNSGAGVARNNSIKEANGRYIAFLDSDDWWYPNKLEKQINFMSKNQYEFTYTAFEYCDENLNIIGISKKAKRISYRKLCVDCNVGNPGVIYDTNRIGKLYMPSIRKRQDWAMFFNIIKQTKYAYSINQPLWKCRLSKHSLSANKMSLVKYNLSIYHDFLGFSRVKTYFYFYCMFLPNNIIKKIKVKIDSYFYIKKLKHKIYHAKK